MKPLFESKYWIEAPSASVTDQPETAVLVLRLALAVNALPSEQGHALLIGNDPQTAAGKRDRVLSFVIAAAFVREALNILTATGDVKGDSKAGVGIGEGGRGPGVAGVDRLAIDGRDASCIAPAGSDSEPADVSLGS